MTTRSNIVALAGAITLVLALPGTLAAAQPSNDFLRQPLMADATIAGRGSAAQGLGGVDGFSPAPMPDIDRDAPVAQQGDPQAARVSPKLFHKQKAYGGEGYVFGSTVQEEQDRRAGPTPGINLIMPLQ